MPRVALIVFRHGASDWDASLGDNRFAGWNDTPRLLGHLHSIQQSAQALFATSGEIREECSTGTAEALRVSRAIHNLLNAETVQEDGHNSPETKEVDTGLSSAGRLVVAAFSSVLRRATETLHIVLSDLRADWLTPVRDWRLNERMYGQLEGVSRAAAQARYGSEVVQRWRRGAGSGEDCRPPPVTASDSRWPGYAPWLYSQGIVSPAEIAALPCSEALLDVCDRAEACLRERVLPAIQAALHTPSRICAAGMSGTSTSPLFVVLVCTHGSVVRAMVRFLDGVPDEKVEQMEIATGAPLMWLMERADGPMPPTNVTHERFTTTDESAPSAISPENSQKRTVDFACANASRIALETGHQPFREAGIRIKQRGPL